MTKEMKDINPSMMLERYKKIRFDSQVQINAIASSTPELNIPSRLDVDRLTWKVQDESPIISQFSLTSTYLGWRSIVHSEIMSGIFDNILAQYCRTNNPEVFPLTKMFKVEFVKPVVSGEILFAWVTKRLPSSGSYFSRESVEAFLDFVHAVQVMAGRLPSTVIRTKGVDTGKKKIKLWVRGNIETIRGKEVITLTKAEALFILCDQLPLSSKHGALPHLERSYMQMPQELWNMVLEHVPSLTGRYAAQAFKFELAERHRRHSNIWHNIFQDGEKWTAIASRQGLNFFLIGDDLHGLFRDPMQPAFLVLSTGDKSRVIRHEKTKFLAALRPHHLNEKYEVVFDESNITLNIDEAIYNSFIITLHPEKLVSYQQSRLRSASLYWTDCQYALRTIGPDDIIGIGERASTIRDVSLICGITLKHSKEMIPRQRQQHHFQHPKCPLTRPIHPSGYVYNGDNILGWELDN